MQKAKLHAYSKLKEGDLFGYYTDQLGALEPRVKITPNDSQNYFYYYFAIVRDYDEHPKKYPMLIELTEDGFFVDLLTGTKLSFVPPEETLSPYVTKGTVNYNDLFKSQYEKEAILDVIINSDEYDPSVFTRSKDDYLTEWNAHNNFYAMFSWTPWGDNAKDVDLNELDRGKQIVWDILGYVDLS